jgi:hypothetical protein
VAPAPEHRRIVTHRGRPLLISGGDLPAGVLDHAVEFFEAKDRGEGPAAQMMRFVAPLLEAAGDDPARRERALSLGTTFWNLALLDEEQRERTIDDIAERLGDDPAKSASFRTMAADMIERHRALFPRMHQTHGQFLKLDCELMSQRDAITEQVIEKAIHEDTSDATEREGRLALPETS